MKRNLIVITYCFLVSCLLGQNNITLNGVRINGEEVDNNIWVFQNNQDTIIALKFEEYKALNKKIEELLAAHEWLDSIIIAKNELIAAFEDYEEKADTHIDVQSKLINVGDSLYLGYKSLYNDLRSIYGMQTFSVILGSGAYNYDKNSWKPYLDVGVAYKNFQGNYQFGKEFKGINLQYVFPLF